MNSLFHWQWTLFLLALGLGGCGPSFQTSESSSDLGQEVRDVVACPDSRSSIFSIYARAYEEKFSTGRDFTFSALSNQNEEIGNSSELRELKEHLKNVHELLSANIQSLSLNQAQMMVGLSEVPSDESDLHRESDPVLHLARLELRSEVLPEYAAINQSLDAELEKAKALAVQSGLDCKQKDPLAELPPAQEPDFVPLPPQQTPSVPAFPPKGSDLKTYHPLFGARWTMATAYQSCSSVEIPVIDANTPSAQGIKRAAQHSDGIGYLREYEEKTPIKSLIVQTHPYFIGQTYSGSCADQRFKPLVYDYGGVPLIEKTDGALNLFLNRGGGSALGVDCSAFVSTSLAKAGNLYTPLSTNKPYFSRHTSRDFTQASGWKCYDTVKVTGREFIRSGDILSILGHVVMIDSVGSDPFGLQRITQVSQCAQMDFRNFDFNVIQSSPDKGSVGINRFKARDYLAGSAGMRAAAVAYAKRACESKFDGKVKTPKTTSFNIIRHKGTAECLAPQIRLVNEACIQTCRSFRAL
jgi:hypothetical protein